MVYPGHLWTYPEVLVLPGTFTHLPCLMLCPKFTHAREGAGPRPAEARDPGTRLLRPRWADA